jgi:hypothetical protein
MQTGRPRRRRAQRGARLAGAAADVGRGFVALEDGFGILVLTGAETPESVELRLLEHTRCVAGL